MSAGIKINSSSGAVMIDASYSNIALIEKVVIPSSKRVAYLIGNNFFTHITKVKNPIVVFPLGTIVYGVSASFPNKDGTTTIKAATRGDNTLTMYIFGTPDEVPSSGPALRIYSDIDGRKVFDSRLKYLKVIGELTKGMNVPNNATWGWLMRERQLQSSVQITSPGSNASGYHLLMLNSWYIHQGKIEDNYIAVQGDYYSRLSDVPYYNMDRIRGVKPLLINLGNL